MKYKNNPANIRYNSANNWLGQIEPKNGFCQFKDLEYGLRALMILIRNYIVKYRKRSVSQIINRFAPVSENNTSAYIRFCTTFLSVRNYSSSVISPVDGSFYVLIQAICWFESNTAVMFEDLQRIDKIYHITKRN